MGLIYPRSRGQRCGVVTLSKELESIFPVCCALVRWSSHVADFFTHFPNCGPFTLSVPPSFSLPLLLAGRRPSAPFWQRNFDKKSHFGDADRAAIRAFPPRSTSSQTHRTIKSSPSSGHMAHDNPRLTPMYYIIYWARK